MREACERYEKEILPSKKSQRKTHSDSYRLALIKKELGRYTLADLPPFHVSRFRISRIAATSPATARRDLNVPSTVLTACVKAWGMSLPKGNVVSLIDLPKPSTVRDRRITGYELTALLTALSETPTVRTVVELAVETALRRSEILGLEWTYLDLLKRTAHIPNTKTGAPRLLTSTTESRYLTRTSLASDADAKRLDARTDVTAT